LHRIGICGNFGVEQEEKITGQIVKTKIIRDQLRIHFGTENVLTINTSMWKRNPIRLFINCVRLSIVCNTILIMPAHNGIKIFAPLFNILCKVFKCKLQYSVIGGWIPELLKKDKKLHKSIESMDTVYVETKTMKNNLIELGLGNVVHMPNFKNIKIVSEKELRKNYSIPYRLCTFSRVSRDKGIIDAINAVYQINRKEGKKVFFLYIFGSIEQDFEDDFNQAIFNSDSSARYSGVVEFEESTEVLKDYFALIFPTYYEGEGFPGTIIDSFSSGLPVIASDWKYNKEIVTNWETGVIYSLDDNDRSIGLQEVLYLIYKNPELVISMKPNCIRKAKKYDSPEVMKKMIQRIRE